MTDARLRYYRLVQESDEARDRLQGAIAQYLHELAAIRQRLRNDVPERQAEFAAVEGVSRTGLAELLAGRCLDRE